MVCGKLTAKTNLLPLRKSLSCRIVIRCIFIHHKLYLSTTIIMDSNEIRELFEATNEQLKKLNNIVATTIEEEDLIVNNLKNPPQEFLSHGQRISDKVARFGGSWKFIISFGVVLFLWILFNTLMIVKFRFDPYPFILLNLILSCIAALQAPIIMMSQNRQEEKDRMRGENDYLIDLKSELQVRGLHKKMDLLLQEQLKTLYIIQEKQILMMNDLHTKVDQLCAVAPDKHS